MKCGTREELREAKTSTFIHRHHSHRQRAMAPSITKIHPEILLTIARASFFPSSHCAARLLDPGIDSLFGLLWCGFRPIP